jgi:outer membrane protein, multidrug efflux system
MKRRASLPLALRAALCAGVVALAGCDLAPPYAPPKIAAPEKFKASVPSGPESALTENWWRNFHDGELDQLESLIESDNPNYAAALARYQQAKAFLDLANSAFFPTLIGLPEISYNKQSENRPLRSRGQPTYYGANQLFGQLSWEIDLWGRVHDLVTAAKAGAQSNDDLLAATRLSLHATMARTYIALRGADAQAALLARTIKLYRSALELTEQRLKDNIAPPIDVERAKVQLANAQAAAAEIAQGRAVLENALAALGGQTASLFRIGASPLHMAPPRLPRLAPASLLLRRPDVAAKERLLYAASEDVGAAKADFLPRFYILMSGGTQSTNLDLLNFQNSLWSYGPGLAAPIFDGGRRQAQLDAARAQFLAAAADYKGSVLAAYQEVENALASIRWLRTESAALSAAATAAQRALDMSMSLYKDGAASSLDVVTSQTAALDAERADIVARTRLLEQYVELMLALGGGWSGQGPAPQPPFPPPVALLGPQGRDPGVQTAPTKTAEPGGR